MGTAVLRATAESRGTAEPVLPAEAPLYAGGTLTELLQTAFGFPSFRTSQEAVCEAVIGGRDVLLVMPTGAGKSLCYQLPAVARGGTALVISPLIALMEDQVAKLKERGLAVERIHSGRDRAGNRRSSPSTKRIVFPNGGTISARTTACSASICRLCGLPRSSP